MTEANTLEGRDLYTWLARSYPVLEAAYSGGAIYRAKTRHLKYLRRGMTVLYPGVGTGEEAVEAALRGVRPTLLEPSLAMLRRAEGRLLRKGIQNYQACHLKLEQYGGVNHDACAAHFFLNVFAEDVVADVIELMRQVLVPGGYLFIADFSPLKGGPFLKWCQNAYWQIPLRVAHRITKEALHPIYDYRPILAESGFQVIEIEDVPIFGVGPGWYRFIAARRSD